MNNIQSKINSELRRPNAGKDALCNVVADVAQAIADNGGGGTSIPEINLISTEEVSEGTEVFTVYNFQDGTDEIIEKLIADNSNDSINISGITMITCYMNYSAVDPEGNRRSFKSILIDQVASNDDGVTAHYQSIFNPLLGDQIFRYVDYPEAGDLNNKWFLN